MALAIRRGIPFTPKSLAFSRDSRIQIVCATVGVVDYCAMYIPPDVPLLSGRWSTLESLLGSSFIILGDFNCKHPVWGCSSTNANGNRLAEFLEDSLCVVVSDGMPSRVSGPNELTSVLDLAICPPSLSPRIISRTLEDSFGSDHFPVLLRLGDIVPVRPPPKFLKNYKRADWNVFRDVCSSSITSSDNYDSFTRKLLAARDAAVPEVCIRPGTVRCRWWDGECSEALRGRKRALLNWRTVRSLGNFREANRQIAICKRLFRVKKRNSFRDFVSGISPASSIAEVWKRVSSLGRGLEPQTQMPRSLTWCDEFLHGLSPDFAAPEVLPESRTTLVPSRFPAGPILLTELESSILRLKSKSSPGEDGIHNLMLKNLPHSSRVLLLSLFNDFWSGVSPLPPSWSDVRVVPIRKRGKPDCIASSYRPISLLSTVRKVFERIIKSRLEWWLESSWFFVAEQVGFRRGRSTSDSLSVLYSDIMSSFASGGEATAVFLDIESAYDNVIPCNKRMNLLKHLSSRS